MGCFWTFIEFNLILRLHVWFFDSFSQFEFQKIIFLNKIRKIQFSRIFIGLKDCNIFPSS